MGPSDRRPLNDLSDAEITRACEQNYLDYWRCVCKSPNAEYSDEDGITRCITGLPQEIFNVVMMCKLSQKDVEAKLDTVIDQLRSRRLNLIWHVGTLTEPSDLGRHLEARGYPHDYDLTAMAADLSSIGEDLKTPEKITVKPVKTVEDCETWIERLTRSWESPPEVARWMLQNACFNISMEKARGFSLPRKMYIGLLDGEPVSASMLYWEGGLAGLQDVGTAHAGRGRGAGGAVVRAAMRDARAMGFSYLVVLSTVEGVGMYKKVGFRTFGKLPEHSLDFRRPDSHGSELPSART